MHNVVWSSIDIGAPDISVPLREKSASGISSLRVRRHTCLQRAIVPAPLLHCWRCGCLYGHQGFVADEVTSCVKDLHISIVVAAQAGMASWQTIIKCDTLEAHNTNPCGPLEGVR